MKTLLLNQNSFREPSISQPLEKNETLTALYLSENPLKNSVGKQLAESLKKNKSLVVLELKLISFNTESETALYETYESSQVLASLWVETTFFSRKQIVNAGLVKPQNGHLISHLIFLQTMVPPSFIQMTHLRFINLSDNKIHELPQRIGDLQNLQELHLKNNQLEYLPYTLATISTLKSLSLDGNPLKVPPKEIVRKGRKEILGYLKDLAEGAEPSYRTKLMVVGQENVG